ncbi:MAG: ABC transporter substrate-binding protein [Alphaproteobacteria bacterium]
MSLVRRALAATAAAGALVAASATFAAAADKITFGTNWVAQAEHGGYYQAVVGGLYAAAGIDVTIRPGGPRIDNAQLLAGGALDFAIVSNSMNSLNFVEAKVPMVAVGAFFQKDPQCFMAHKGAYKSIADMKGAKVEISAGSRATYWPFLVKTFGLSDDQIRPYNFQIAPLVADKTLVQQGYITVSGYQAAAADIDADLFHFFDYGWSSYSAIMTTSQKLVDENPDLVKRFMDATIKGWYAYLHGDPSKADAMILQHNPDYTQKKLDESRAAMKQFGIVEAADTATMGIGAMTDARWKDFYDKMVASGLYKADLDYKKAYTLAFVNKKVGM